MAVDLTAFVCFSPLKVIYNTLSPSFCPFEVLLSFWSSFPKREARNVWCYPPAVLESQGYRLIPLSISSLVLLVLPNPFALSVLSFFCWWPILWAFPSEGFIHYIYSHQFVYCIHTPYRSIIPPVHKSSIFYLSTTQQLVNWCSSCQLTSTTPPANQSFDYVV